MSKFCTVIVPYYNQPEMLKRHLALWMEYGEHIRDRLDLIVVDDGSMEHEALHVIANVTHSPLRLYRITQDIPWNRGGARNLGAQIAETPWLLHMDIDHLMPVEAAQALVSRARDWNPKKWYRFRRFRVGAADDTRMKDQLPRTAKFGEIKPHIDSYLCTKALYWKAGGYNEDFSGCLGGGSPFLRELEKVGPVTEAPPDIFLQVLTKDACPDASASKLSRDRTEYKKRSDALKRAGKIKGHDPIRFAWERLL
ncbi:MAG: glycosyltransferase [Rhizorhabdus sp.]|uniref:glycosyltransferase family 2 protein n=1 Tax=Rhizorhabdus sp. TaxID=1968843 RepID=UPI001B46B756|nr:glycosyltransferase [Rhizorhabdus sp.]MBP8231744.1 glycosyltransferase [Rhizorhabdus sp.]